MDAYSNNKGGLAKVELEDVARWRLTWPEFKLLFIASTGFFIDAYDLFIINIVVVILNYTMFGKLSGSIAQISLKGGTLKAAANIGCVVGQIGFGFMGDVFGRRAVYGKELIVAMVATIMIIAVPNSIGPVNVMTWITVFRVLLGIGIGGDYPMSASVVADRAILPRRGVMLSFIFSMQGWGNFFGALLTIILMAIYQTSIQKHGNYGHFNSLWRILVGIILVPCCITLYQRLTLPESAKMKTVHALRDDPTLLQKHDSMSSLKHADDADSNNVEKVISLSEPAVKAESERGGTWRALVGAGEGAQTAHGKSQAWRDFREYFSEWKHAKVLIGTTMTWFLVDITFYGINLNQSIVLGALGYTSATEPWEYIWQQAKGNMIIAAAGFLPGYYFTMFTIEYLGRRPIQFFGFLFEALFLGILAGDYFSLKTKHASFIAVFALLQFFFNYGANATTFITAAESYPTRVRGMAHGLSAGCGKCGAIIASLGFAEAANSIGTNGVLWIFFGISFLGAAFTLLVPETKGVDPDVVDLEERQAAAGLNARMDGTTYA